MPHAWHLSLRSVNPEVARGETSGERPFELTSMKPEVQDSVCAQSLEVLILFMTIPDHNALRALAEPGVLFTQGSMNARGGHKKRSLKRLRLLLSVLASRSCSLYTEGMAAAVDGLRCASHATAMAMSGVQTTDEQGESSRDTAAAAMCPVRPRPPQRFACFMALLHCSTTDREHSRQSAEAV